MMAFIRNIQNQEVLEIESGSAAARVGVAGELPLSGYRVFFLGHENPLELESGDGHTML